MRNFSCNETRLLWRNGAQGDGSMLSETTGDPALLAALPGVGRLYGNMALGSTPPGGVVAMVLAQVLPVY
jgi:hypothetical protein